MRAEMPGTPKPTDVGWYASVDYRGTDPGFGGCPTCCGGRVAWVGEDTLVMDCNPNEYRRPNAHTFERFVIIRFEDLDEYRTIHPPKGGENA